MLLGILSAPVDDLKFDDVEYLKRMISHRPDWFSDKLQYLLLTNHFISVHFTTIHRELERARISTKKLKKIAAERNENVWADFIRRMTTRLVFALDSFVVVKMEMLYVFSMVSGSGTEDIH